MIPLRLRMRAGRTVRAQTYIEKFYDEQPNEVKERVGRKKMGTELDADQAPAYPPHPSQPPRRLSLNCVSEHDVAA